MKNAQWENWVNLVLGVWLFATPWTVAHRLAADLTNMMSWNSWLVGLAVAISAGMALQELKPWEEWVNLVLGVWIVLSPWIFGYASEASLTWNSIVVGLCIAVFSGISIPVAQKLQR
jgi:hypothetical protein